MLVGSRCYIIVFRVQQGFRSSHRFFSIQFFQAELLMFDVCYSGKIHIFLGFLSSFPGILGQKFSLRYTQIESENSFL